VTTPIIAGITALASILLVAAVILYRKITKPMEPIPQPQKSIENISRRLLPMMSTWSHWQNPVCSGPDTSPLATKIARCRITEDIDPVDGPAQELWAGKPMHQVLKSGAKQVPDTNVWELYRHWSRLTEQYIRESSYIPDWQEAYSFTPITFVACMLLQGGRELLDIHAGKRYKDFSRLIDHLGIDTHMDLLGKWFLHPGPTAGDLTALFIVTSHIRWWHESLVIVNGILESLVPKKRRDDHIVRSHGRYLCENLETTERIINKSFAAVNYILSTKRKSGRAQVKLHISSDSCSENCPGNAEKYLSIPLFPLKRLKIRKLKRKYLPEFRRLALFLEELAQNIGRFSPLNGEYFRKDGGCEQDTDAVIFRVFENETISRNIAQTVFQWLSDIRIPGNDSPGITQLGTIFKKLATLGNSGNDEDKDNIGQEKLVILRFFGYVFLDCLHWWNFKKNWPQWNTGHHYILVSFKMVIKYGDRLARQLGVYGIGGEIIRLTGAIKEMIRQLEGTAQKNFDDFQESVTPKDTGLVEEVSDSGPPLVETRQRVVG